MKDADAEAEAGSSLHFSDAQVREAMDFSASGGKGMITTVHSSVDTLNQNPVGNLHVSVVEGRNFSRNEKGGKLRPSVELRLGEHRVRTDTVKDTLSPSWLADFILPVPCEDSELWVSVIDSDLLLESELLIGKARVAVSELLCSGTRVQWIQLKDLDDNGVGEICVVLQYSNPHALPSSTAASTSSEIRDDNQYGLKALLCPTQSSSNDARYNPDDTQVDCAVQSNTPVPKDDRLETLTIEDAPESTRQLEKTVTAGPSTVRSQVLQMQPFFEELCAGAVSDHDRKKSCNDNETHCGQHAMIAVAGALLAILVAVFWGNSFCKKKPQDEKKNSFLRRGGHWH